MQERFYCFICCTHGREPTSGCSSQHFAITCSVLCIACARARFLAFQFFFSRRTVLSCERGIIYESACVLIFLVSRRHVSRREGPSLSDTHQRTVSTGLDERPWHFDHGSAAPQAAEKCFFTVRMFRQSTNSWLFGRPWPRLRACLPLPRESDHPFSPPPERTATKSI